MVARLVGVEIPGVLVQWVHGSPYVVRWPRVRLHRVFQSVYEIRVVFSVRCGLRGRQVCDHVPGGMGSKRFQEWGAWASLLYVVAVCKK